MGKNYNCSFDCETDLNILINETLEKLQAEASWKVSKADFFRACIMRACLNLKYGTLTSEVLWRKQKENKGK